MRTSDGGENMKNVYVVDALRTPFGSFGGSLADVPAPHLAGAVMKALLEKVDLAPEAVDEVIVGNVLAGGCGQAPARQAMRAAGIPDKAAALTVNKVCGSGLKAIQLGVDALQLGHSEVVIAGGMESMSLAPYILKKARTGYRMGNGEIVDLMICDGLQDPYSGQHMGVIADDSAARNGFSREEQDEFALRSYRLAQAAVTEGVFRDEIVPFVKTGKKGDVTVDTDEGPFKIDLAKLTQLRPAFKKDGTITAGNASPISDGAAVALLTDEAGLKKFGLTPKARFVAAATESLHPDYFPDAPVGAIEKACAQAGLSIGDIDLFEINEAFSVVAMISIKSLGLDVDKVNVNGGACALGHPIGASGGRLAATVVRELQRRQCRYGLAVLCLGGGEAFAAIFERV
jgi:acetyl-CoA C-acetyltransferase